MLVGREHEVSVLRRMLDSVPLSVAKSALIEGGPGTGKTSLLRKAVDLAHVQGLRTVSARGRAREQRIPLAVARHLVESMLADLTGDSHTTFVPGWGDDPAEFGGRVELEQMPELLAAMYSVTKEISDRYRLVIVIDDLQWVDAASLHYLDHLLARLESVSVHVVATYTPGHPGAHASLLADLTSQFGQRLVLQDLDEQGAETMLTKLLDNHPDAAFTRACLEATGCNPLFLATLSREIRRRRTPQDASGVAEVAEIGPAELAERVFTRYFSEASGTVAALETVAMLEESATEYLVAELTGSHRAEAALRWPIDLGLLRWERDSYSFVHPVLRGAVVNRIAATERERRHLESAKVLYRAGAPKERVARELMRASRCEQQHWVAEVLCQSAQEAASANREDDARSYLQVALDICPDDARGSILRTLGRIEMYSDPSAAAEHLRLAMEYPWPDETLAEINTELASTVYLTAGAAAAVEVLSLGLQKITSTHGRAGIEHDLQVFKVLAGTASACGGDGSDDAAGGQRAHEKQAVLATLRESWRGTSRTRALRFAEQAVEDSALSRHPLGHTIALVTMVYSDEFGVAQAEFERLMAYAGEQDAEAVRASRLLIQTLINYRIGDLIQCHHDGAEVLEMLPGDATDGRGHSTTRRFAASKVVAALLEMGSGDEARAQLDRDWPAVDTCDGLDCALLLFERGRLRVARGEVREGLRDLEECGQRMTALGVENPAVCPWRSELALAHIAMGNVELAIPLAEEELERARAWGAPRTLGKALRAAGLAHRGQRGLALLTESHEVLSGSPALLERARTRLHLGVALRKRNRLAEARKHLRESRVLAEKCGARPLSWTAGEELVAAGARPRRVAQIGPDALTPSECRVAMLAAQGHTNREIAEQLHVLQRTVEIHLSRTYHKLGIPGRHQLAAAISPKATKGKLTKC